MATDTASECHEERKTIFLGDLVDRGPKIVDVLRLVMGMVEAGTALCVPGNHDTKLLQKLRGKDVKIAHGLADSIAQLDSESPEFKSKVTEFLDRLVSHYVLDDGKLVVAHAGMKEEMQGRGSAAVRAFALFGEPRERPMSSAFLSATTGQPTIAAKRLTSLCSVEGT